MSVLSRRGWTLLPARGVRRGLDVVRAEDGCLLFTLSIESTGAKSITPGVRVTARRRHGRVSAADKAALAELIAELTLSLESRLGRNDLAQPWALAESHRDWSGLNGPGAEELILRTTYACSQRCRFCFVPHGRAVPAAQVEAELERLAARRNSRGELTLSGGEPAADPRLPRILESARRRGFRRFIVQTNAVFLARAGLVERLTELGAESFLVSLHSHVPETYDRITRSRGQLALAEQGLKRLLACGEPVSVTVNVVVNAWNFEGLSGLMDRLADLAAGGSAPRVFFSVINEIGHELAPEAAVDFARVAPSLRAALARCRARGLAVERFAGESAFPLCLLEPAQWGALAPREPLGQDRVRYAESAEGAVGRLKRPQCRRCRFDSRCLGVAATYARLFGLSALRGPA